MKRINSKIKKIIPIVLGGMIVVGTLASLCKQKKQRERIDEQEIFLDTLFGEQDLVIDELIYQQDIITKMEEALESFSDIFNEEIFIHEVEGVDN